MALVVAAAGAFAQGRVNFANSATTLISAGGSATVVGQQYYYALFLAPSTTVLAGGQSRPLGNDPDFAVQGGSNVTQHATAAGRIAGVNNFVAGGAGGGTVDFIVRGWSANAGNTWAEALANWNNGSPISPTLGAGMFFGQSTIGNDLLLGDGGAIGATTLFGAGATQAGGFNMAFYPVVPEPSSMALAGLGAASLLLFRRRK